MIYFPATLTPVPLCPGYFWDVEKHKMYSLKIGGVLRELKRKKLWGGVAYHFPRQAPSSYFYTLYNKGRRRYMFVEDLKRLELVHYDMPVINLVEQVEPA